MVPEELQTLVAFLKSTDLVEITWERNGTRISLRRDEVGIDIVPPPATELRTTSRAAQEVVSVVGADLQVGPPSAPPSESSPVPAAPTIRSPMVGTFLRSAGVGRAPLVEVGSRVAPGQKVCVIEVMKILKDVTASESGRIAKVLVESGRPVEYGQPLFLLEPD